MTPEEKTAAAVDEMLAAYDERTRTFNDLRDMRKDPAERKARLAAYADANRNFEKAKAEALKLER